MAEPLTREQFRTAVADAVNGLLNVYREVDAMLRELGTILSEAEPRFVQLGKKLVPASGSKNFDARYLRNYHAAIFAPADTSEEEEEVEDEDEEEDENDEGDGEVEKKPKRPLTIATGSGIIVAQATIYDRARQGFEPNLVVRALMRCRADSQLVNGTRLKVSRYRFRKILRAMNNHLGAPGKPLHTGVSVQVSGQPKTKYKLIFDVLSPVQSIPLFEITPEKLQEIASKARQDWLAVPPL